MRYVDASVFLHAFLKPKRILTSQEIQIKEDAKKIVRRINLGERVLISVIHVGEIANVLEDYLPLQEALEIERAVCFRDSVEIETVDTLVLTQALGEAERWNIGLTDALAYVLMKTKMVNEIYSFDRDFDRLNDIKRITR
jgi:predicted nucleic acid-binding protein